MDEFLAACDAAFSFLVREFGFERLSLPMAHNRYSVRFRKKEFEVDVFGESYGNSADCQLVRGNDRLYLGLLLPQSAQTGAPRDSSHRWRPSPRSCGSTHGFCR
jgi:hypothetical protein